MSKPENTFRRSVHKFFDLDRLHHEKMSNPYRAGGADDWYSGKGKTSKDLWIEWKFIVVPVRDETMIDLCHDGKKPTISALQQEWLRGRFEEGRNVAVGVGSAKGGILLWNLEWEASMPAREFRSRMQTRNELAKSIMQFVHR